MIMLLKIGAVREKMYINPAANKFMVLQTTGFIRLIYQLQKKKKKNLFFFFFFFFGNYKRMLTFPFIVFQIRINMIRLTATLPETDHK